MTSSLRLSSTAELLAAVPALMGFTPEQSLVLLGASRDGTRSRIGLTLRADLPDTPDESATLAAQLTESLRTNDMGGVVVLVIDRAGDPDDPPRQTLLACLARALEDRHIELTHALWVPWLAAGQPYACYEDAEHRGVQNDPRASTVTATAVHHGLPVLGSREQLAEELTPNAAVDQERRAQLVLAEVIRTAGETAAYRHQRYRVLQAALRAAADGVLPDTESAIVALLVALSDPAVRDTGIADSAASAQQLWTFLTREAPTPARPEPAVLLAVTAYRNGDGARARVALDTALQCNPEHTLALLLDAALEQGLPPSRCEPAFRTAADQAARLCQPSSAAAPHQSAE